MDRVEIARGSTEPLSDPNGVLSALGLVKENQKHSLITVSAMLPDSFYQPTTCKSWVQTRQMLS